MHRLQVVTFGDPPGSVIGLEVREYIRPDNVASAPPGSPVVYQDGRGYRLGLTKMWRPEHARWLAENLGEVEVLLERARREWRLRPKASCPRP